MTSEIFNVFGTTSYTFLKLAQGVDGNTIEQEYAATGIFKSRDGMVQVANVESKSAAPTLHVRPTEDFLADVDHDMVGHGIRATKNGSTQSYRITGQVEGYDFNKNELAFYKLTLKPESIATWDEPSLPLE